MSRFKSIFKKISFSKEPRGDMYLPDWLLVFGILLIIAGLGILISMLFNFNSTSLILGLVTLIIGIAAILCWKNQSIKILSSYEFEYTTFLGNKKVYKFNEIQGMISNNDSITLIVANQKVHIESCAIMSEELISKINHELERIQKESE